MRFGRIPYSRHKAGADHDSEMAPSWTTDATNQQEFELRASELAREKLEHRNAQLEIDLATSKRHLCLGKNSTSVNLRQYLPPGSLASQGQRITLHVSANVQFWVS